ncbi:hypothetical protein EMWEY_00056790, partial [Eimeria maxima]
MPRFVLTWFVNTTIKCGAAEDSILRHCAMRIDLQIHVVSDGEELEVSAERERATQSNAAHPKTR